jgi:hypothetical protein
MTSSPLGKRTRALDARFGVVNGVFCVVESPEEAAVVAGPVFTVIGKTLVGPKVTLTCSPDTSIAELRRQFSTKVNLKPEELRLRFCAKDLVDDSTAAGAGLKNDMVVHLIRKDPEDPPPTDGTIRVACKLLTGKSLVVCVSPKGTVEDLKKLIAKAEGIPVDQQRLIYSGKQLEDQRTLADYNIVDKAAVHCVLRLRGGMMHETSGRADMEALGAPGSGGGGASAGAAGPPPAAPGMRLLARKLTVTVSEGVPPSMCLCVGGPDAMLGGWDPYRAVRLTPLDGRRRVWCWFPKTDDAVTEFMFVMVPQEESSHRAPVWEGVPRSAGRRLTPAQLSKCIVELAPWGHLDAEAPV